MSRNTKIILGVLAGLLLLACVCAGAVTAGLALFTVRNTSASINPALVEQAAIRVMGDAPAGWHGDYAVRIGEFEIVGYRPESGEGHIVYAYFGPRSHGDIDSLARDIRNWTDGRYGWNQNEMREVERRAVLLGDQEAELVIYEGKGSSGPWKQALVAFQSERGFTLAMLGLPAGQWTEAQLDEFIYALR